MFFNLYRSTKAAEKEYKKIKLLNSGKNIINSKEKFFNLRSRQKVQNVLTKKFMKKYKLKSPEQSIDNEISKFIQGDKLTDKDLQNLDFKIDKIMSSIKSVRKNRPLSTKKLSQKDIKINPISQSQSLPPIQQNKNDSSINETENKQLKKLHPSASVDSLPKYKNTFQSPNPEEELAKLEEELADFLPKKKEIKRLDFSGIGNEWYAMALYNKQLYEEKVLEEKKKENELRQKIREELNAQIKSKIKKEQEEKLREEQEEKAFQEKLKQMDILEKEKKERIKQQIINEKLSRELQIKDDYIRKRIEKLKKRKYELNLIKTIKKEMEDEKKVEIEKKIKENEVYKKVLKENEIYREKQKELLKKRLEEEDKETCQEMEKSEIKKELEREKYFANIRRPVNDYDSKKTEDVIFDKNKNNKKEENEKILQLFKEEQKKELEEEKKAKLKKIEEIIKLQKFYDEQIKEKKKQLDLMKSLDKEQERLWKEDNIKYNEEKTKKDNILKNLKEKNYEALREQIKKKKQEKEDKQIMTLDEYAINRELLEKAKEKLEKKGILNK
jgi:hypothetical protein